MAGPTVRLGEFTAPFVFGRLPTPIGQWLLEGRAPNLAYNRRVRQVTIPEVVRPHNSKAREFLSEYTLEFSEMITPNNLNATRVSCLCV